MSGAPDRAVQLVRAGLQAVYVSSWHGQHIMALAAARLAADVRDVPT